MSRRNKRGKNNATLRRVKDGFQNFAARVGVGTGNPATGPKSGITYGKASYLSRQQNVLNAMFRESWIVNKAVVVIPEDMTKRGIEIEASWDADKLKTFRRFLIRLSIWYSLQSALCWSRLYGGSAALLMIDGQDLSTPLATDSISQGQFKGLYVYNRWTLTPDLNTEIQEYGSDYGKPEYYIVNNGKNNQGARIHHSRLLIFTGLELPEPEDATEEGWGASMVETMYDRLVAFDSTTLGVSQLVYRAYLRTIKINKFREILAMGGAAEAALVKQMDSIRQWQVNEGLTLLDKDDEFQAAQYTFAGLDHVLLSFGEQLSGATGIPLVRLFGQSPSGLNSTGESDLRTYYDTIKATQEIDLRHPMMKICDVMSRSVFGEPLPEDFWFEFAPLWELSDMEKADIASKDTASIASAYDMGLISQSTALKELKASGVITGRWDKITDEEIEEAESAPPSSELLGAGGEEGAGLDLSGLNLPGSALENLQSTATRDIIPLLTTDADVWITLPNGEHVLTRNGVVIAGAGGKFNG
jgi:phage-related protein (TIGR01555 family)